MNILGLHIGKAEHRLADYTQAVNQAVQDALSSASTARPDSLAVVELCVGMIADPFAVADLTGPVLSRQTLHTAARDVLKYGNSVWAIDTANGNLELQRAYKWDVSGFSMDPATWTYDLELCVPDGVVKRTVLAPGVVHLRLPGDADSPWIGRAPWENAKLSADAMAELERGIRDESRIYSGRVWTAPDGATAAQATAMASTIKQLKGGKQVVSETTAAGFGAGKNARPDRDWQPVNIGQSHSVGNVQMRESVESSIASAYGLPGAYTNPNATAPALREVKRLTFLNKTLPLASMFMEELSDKLASTVAIGWSNLADQSVDVHLRARAAASAQELVSNMETLLELVGLPQSAQ